MVAPENEVLGYSTSKHATTGYQSSQHRSVGAGASKCDDYWFIYLNEVTWLDLETTALH